MTNGPTSQDVLEAIGEFSIRIDEKFGVIDQRFGAIEKRLGGMEQKMVTKDYLDARFETLRSDLIAISRKTNIKLAVLIERLVQQGTLKRQVADQILALEPFPQ